MKQLVLNVMSSVGLRFFPKRTLRSIRIIFTDLDSSKDEILGRLEAAFDHIVIGVPSYSRSLDRIRHIVVWPGHYTAADTIGGVLLCSAHVRNLTSIQLASVLIHESIHLRISHCKIAYTKDLRGRIESLCAKEQARFLRSFGEIGEQLADDVERSLDVPWWSEVDDHDDIERLMADNDIPRWLIPLMRLRT